LEKKILQETQIKRDIYSSECQLISTIHNSIVSQVNIELFTMANTKWYTNTFDWTRSLKYTYYFWQ